MNNSISPKVNCCGYWILQISLQLTQSHIPHMFDHWADPVVHLILLKTFVVKVIEALTKARGNLLVLSSVTRWSIFGHLSMEHLSKCNFLAEMFQKVSKYEMIPKIIAKDLHKIWPKWQNFAKSGHTGPQPFRA